VDNGTAEGAAYLQDWHDRHPGATSALLAAMTDDNGRSTYEVLAEALRHGNGPVLDLACGDGHLLQLLRTDRDCLGTDWNIAELRAASHRLGRGAPLIRADAVSLPIATATLGAVGCHYALMLLRPLEAVLTELARVTRPGGLLACVVPASTSRESAGPISVFRAAWQVVTATLPVDIPPIQDDRAVDPEDLAVVLAEAGFASVSVQSISVTKQMTVEETIESVLLTYLPDLLPPAGLTQLRDLLEAGFSGIADDTGLITFSYLSDLVSARRS
jgi:SAM-dependent methyltransferase